MILAAASAALLGAGPVPGGEGVAPPSPSDCTVPTFAYRHGTVSFTEHGQTAEVRVEIADTSYSRDVGLMCRTALEADAGMLFVFEDDTGGPFWMKNTLIPLSIAFIDARWHIVAILAMNVESDPSRPNPNNLYAPKDRSYRYALEVNQGFFAQHGLDGKAEVRFLRQAAGAPSTRSTQYRAGAATASP
jgi:uncharacterized membrane protein (UPF0127 family)